MSDKGIGHAAILADDGGASVLSALAAECIGPTEVIDPLFIEPMYHRRFGTPYLVAYDKALHAHREEGGTYEIHATRLTEQEAGAVLVTLRIMRE